MPRLLVLFLFASLAGAGEVIASGTVSVTATEDSTDNTITYANIRDALVTGSSPASSSTYKYRINTVGTTTKALKTSAPAAVVPGTTVVVPSSPGVNQTTYLQYTPVDDEFTLFPTTSNRSTPAVAIATVDVLDTAGTTVLETVELRIDIQGVTDLRNGVGGYYLAGITQPAAIVVPRGGSVQMNYVELAARCGFLDKERDGYLGFSEPIPSGFGGSDGWSLAVDNPPGSWLVDAFWVKGTFFNLFWAGLTYGSSSDYSTDSLTISMPSNHPLGTFDLLGINFYYDPDQGGPMGAGGTNIVYLRVTVVAAGGSGSEGGSSGSSGGCGLGVVSSLVALAFAALAMRLRMNG